MNTFLFCDIETIPVVQHFKDAPDELRHCYIKKFRHEIEGLLETESEEEFDATVDMHWKKTAALYAEFGKIVSVAVGRLAADNNFYVASYCDSDEVKILNKLCKQIEQLGITYIVGHNFKNFDGPYLMRRMIINKIKVPKIINSAGVKAWELPQGDTMELWSGSQWKHMISLDLLAQLLGIPSPKEEMDGSQVAETFYAGDYEKISAYNCRDIITTARVFCALKGFRDIEPKQVVIIQTEQS